MRDGIRVSSRIEFEKGDVSITHPESNSPINRFFDVEGDQWNKFVQTIGTSAEIIKAYEVQPGGYLFIKNLDDTNYVSLVNPPGSWVDEIVRIGPGKVFWCRTGPSFYTDFRIKADTASCDCIIVSVDP